LEDLRRPFLLGLIAFEWVDTHPPIVLYFYLDPENFRHDKGQCPFNEIEFWEEPRKKKKREDKRN
jgi:hypothetical protein